MGDHLKVDPADLHAGSAHVENHATELVTAHSAAHGRMATAASGLIGTSSAALAALTAHWESESSAHFTEMLDHAERIRTAAGRYESTDAATSAEIDAAAEDLHRRMGL